jgi:hypothetical protein
MLPDVQTPRTMPGMPDAATMTKPKTGAEMISPDSVAAPVINRQAPPLRAPGSRNMPITGSPGSTPLPGSAISQPTVAPRMNQGPPALPSQGDALSSRPHAGAMTPPLAVPGVDPESPVTRTPKINTRVQRYRLQGTLPKAGPQEAAPLPGTKVGGTPPFATDTPR